MSCSSGFYLSDSICIACPSNCDTCSNSGSCITFKPGTGQISITINNTVYPTVCDPGCVSCSNQNPSICLSCKEGFVLS